jgi:hypothetical protein
MSTIADLFKAMLTAKPALSVGIILWNAVKLYR